MKEAGAKAISAFESIRKRPYWAALLVHRLDYSANYCASISVIRALCATGLVRCDFFAQDRSRARLWILFGAIGKTFRAGCAQGHRIVRSATSFRPNQLLAAHHYNWPGITMLSSARQHRVFGKSFAAADPEANIRCRLLARGKILSETCFSRRQCRQAAPRRIISPRPDEILC